MRFLLNTIPHYNHFIQHRNVFLQYYIQRSFPRDFHFQLDHTNVCENKRFIFRHINAITAIQICCSTCCRAFHYNTYTRKRIIGYIHNHTLNHILSIATCRRCQHHEQQEQIRSCHLEATFFS